MTSYGNYPAFDLEFNMVGDPVDAAALPALTAWLTSPAGAATTDVVFISHGWNNDMTDARGLYTNFFTAMQQVQAAQNVATERRFAVAAILWPSKRFADADLIPGGAAALAPDTEAALNASLDTLKSALAADDAAGAARVEQARALVPTLGSGPAAQDAFVAALAGAVPAATGPRDEGMDHAVGQVLNGSVDGSTVLQRLSKPVFPSLSIAAAAAHSGDGQGHALGLGDLVGNAVGSIKGAAARLANLFTYYTMKDRAATVATNGVLKAIVAVQAAKPGVRVHLLGHSFGGRLVTAAANALPGSSGLASLLLMEAAYSHNGVSVNWDGAGDDGSFRAVVGAPKVSGPILITHSVHDTAVGLAYPLASRLMSQVASAVAAATFGGPTDKFGGMGRNGAQHTPEAFDDTLLPVGAGYAPLPAGKTVRNLNGDGPAPKPVILNHSDVAKPEIVWAWLSTLPV